MQDRLAAPRMCPTALLHLFLAKLEVFDEHLLDRLVIGTQNLPNAMPAHQMANLFDKVLGVVSGSLQRLRYEEHMGALLTRRAFEIFQVPQEDEIAQPI